QAIHGRASQSGNFCMEGPGGAGVPPALVRNVAWSAARSHTWKSDIDAILSPAPLTRLATDRVKRGRLARGQGRFRRRVPNQPGSVWRANFSHEPQRRMEGRGLGVRTVDTRKHFQLEIRSYS